MDKKLNNYAFIDGQNLNLGIQHLGWNLDFKKFRVYLKEKYQTGAAYYFIECSHLLNLAAGNQIAHMNELKQKLEYKKAL